MKKIEGHKKNKRDLYISLIVLTIFTVFILWNMKEDCKRAAEIKSYASIEKNVLYVGKNSCPSIRSINKVKIDDISNLTDKYDGIIITDKKSSDVEDAISRKYPEYFRYTVGEDKSIFYVYNLGCEVCEK